MPLSCIDLGGEGRVRLVSGSGDSDPDGTPEFERKGDQESSGSAWSHSTRCKWTGPCGQGAPGEVSLGYGIAAHEESPDEPQDWIQHQPRIHCFLSGFKCTFISFCHFFLNEVF